MKEADRNISITLFFPCYNEQDNIVRVVEQALKVAESMKLDYELILVNDGSSDNTGPLADQLARDHERVRVVHHRQNAGYGAALQSGFAAAQKEWVFYTDGDGQFDLAELPPLLDLISDCDIVSCYRLNRQDPLVRRFTGWCWTQLVCWAFDLHLHDIDCAFKLYRRKLFDEISLCSTGALIDAEILARAARKGYRIKQRGVHHYPRTSGQQTGANWRVVLRAFKELLQLRKRIIRGD